MIKNIQIILKPNQINDDKLISKIVAAYAKIDLNDINSIVFNKRSLDARGKNPKYILQASVFTDKDFPCSDPIYDNYKNTNDKQKVIIIGAGPAGYFAALELLEYGLKPVIFERGKDVRSRRRDLRNVMQKGIVHHDSNYCFGEGGAGTYSDGKLYTRSNKRGDINKILNILVEHGADRDILIDAHPHIGSNKLPKIITSIRETIEKFGGEVHFNSKMTDIIIENNIARAIEINHSDKYFADNIILATGHSARDIYYLLDRKHIFIESKPFAVGFRIEHPQALIDTIQYGKIDYDLPAASYKLVTQVKNKGVFSFCMCPGGLIVPSSTAPKELVVNGMSMSRRSSEFANSGIVTQVDADDYSNYESFGALAGLKFQEMLENKFYSGHENNLLEAPAQNMTDFVFERGSKGLNSTSYIPGIYQAKLYRMFPKQITNRIQSGLKIFGKKMKGYMTDSANVIGLESRTSSPVRITRDPITFEHKTIKNLFPAGEGAGYAGGIVSSAIDGQNAAKAIVRSLNIEIK